MERILREPEASLTKQYVALLATEGVKIDFADDGIKELAALATRFNRPVPIILGILFATLANHALAALLGMNPWQGNCVDGLASLRPQACVI